MNTRARLESIRSQLPASCKLIAVTKTHSADTILEAYNAGHRLFGENKVQELAAKFEALPHDIEWHLIGHLQTNKVKYIAPFVSLIHSVDSLRLLEEIDKQGKKNDRKIRCLLQMHIATEETKFGLSEKELHELLSSPHLIVLDHVNIIGLMGMATLTDNHERIRGEFRGLRSIFDKLKGMRLPENVKMIELSMGMSGDYTIAVEEGSTMVRVGSAIFGQRNSPNQSTG
jgi:PLP dependent protein